jgi:hypothetical protein
MRSLWQATRATTLSILAFGTLFAVSAQVAGLRTESPWSDDPYDALSSYAAIVVPLVMLPTWIRVARYARTQTLPVYAVRHILRGNALALCWVVAALTSDTAAFVSAADRLRWGASLNLLLAVLVPSGALAVRAATLVVRAWKEAQPLLATESSSAADPDVLDDLAGILPALGRANDAFDRWPLSPRRHRLGLCLLVSIIAGAASVGWHTLQEGPWSAAAPAIIFGLLSSGAVAIGLTLSVRMLGLLRPARDQVSCER